MTSAEAAARPGMIRRIYDFVLRNAEQPRAWAVLAAVAFAESSFFPLPADLLLIPMLLANRRRAFLLAGWATLWSVLGGVLGYAIGHLLYDYIGAWLVQLYGMGGDVEAFRESYKANAWLIVLQGLTPIPYKIVTISAGLAGVAFPLFVLLSVVTRGFRYMAEATLFYFLGDRARLLLEKYLAAVLFTVLAVVIAGFVAVKYLF